jgi:hypothetical protein
MVGARTTGDARAGQGRLHDGHAVRLDFYCGDEPEIFHDEQYRMAGRLDYLVRLRRPGVRHLFSSLKEHFDHYTYSPGRISVTRPIKQTDKHFKRSVAWMFVICGYLLSLGTGILIGMLTEDISAQFMSDNKIADAVLVGLFYPPIAVLIVDMMYIINLRFDDL